MISSNVKLQRSEGHCDHIYQRPVVSCLLQKHDAQVSLKTYCLHEVVNVDRRRKHRWRDETVNLLSNDVFDLVVDQSQVVVDLSLRHRQRESGPLAATTYNSNLFISLFQYVTEHVVCPY